MSESILAQPNRERLFVSYTPAAALADWVVVVTTAQSVVATRRGPVADLREWVNTVYPGAHSRERHLRGLECNSCDRERAWARG
jgi:hypothetical protein